MVRARQPMFNASFSMFFDRPAVRNMADRNTIRALAKLGAYGRKMIQRKISDRRRASRPGEAPTSQTGILRKGIFFHYNPRAMYVDIGPAPLASRSANKYGYVPDILEYGGRTIREIYDWKKQRTRFVNIHIRPRPYTNPILHRLVRDDIFGRMMQQVLQGG